MHRASASLAVVLLTLACGSGVEPTTPTDGATPPAGGSGATVQPGWVAPLSTRQHGVRGTVTVQDASTLVLSGFDYDGGGLGDVRVHLARGGAFASGIAVGPQLAGTRVSGATVTLPLPAGTTLSSFDSVSVWCVAARVSFGDASFRAP